MGEELVGWGGVGSCEDREDKTGQRGEEASGEDGKGEVMDRMKGQRREDDSRGDERVWGGKERRTEFRYSSS